MLQMKFNSLQISKIFRLMNKWRTCVEQVCNFCHSAQGRVHVWCTWTSRQCPNIALILQTAASSNSRKYGEHVCDELGSHKVKWRHASICMPAIGTKFDQSASLVEEDNLVYVLCGKADDQRSRLHRTSVSRSLFNSEWNCWRMHRNWRGYVNFKHTCKMQRRIWHETCTKFALNWQKFQYLKGRNEQLEKSGLIKHSAIKI